jgi:heme-degrading monooxygenase HmoA
LQPPDIEYFEQISQSGASGGAGFLACCDLRIGANSPAMTLEQELRLHLSKAPGFREYRLYRSMGGESRFFRAEFWEGEDRAADFWRSPDRRDLMARLAANLPRGAPRFRHYEVLDQLGSAANHKP